MKILVAIANYGTKNDSFLHKVLGEYHSLPYEKKIVVYTNVEKDLGTEVETIVTKPPTSHPHSFPYWHRRLFIEKADEYDLFIYTEDDILITPKNIESFLEVTSYLPEDHVVGFMRYEYGVDNKVYMPDIHASFHWWPDSVQKFGSYTLAEFSNKHAGSYLLTRSSLKIAINSGKYSIEPERSRNGILESAASDLFEYWGCGLKKLICISHLDQFLIHHMPDKYVGKLGILKDDLEVQIQALMGTTQDCVLFPGSLFQTETKLLWRRFDKSYYPLSNQQIIQMIGSGSKRILSVGCGYPETELELQNKGHEVIAIPLDAIIAVNANAKAIKTVVPNFEEAINSLSSQRFDYIIFDEILPHLQEVETVLVQFAKLLKNHGSIIATMLNGKSTRIQYPLKGKYHPKSGPSLNPFLPLEPASDNFNNFKALGLHLTNEKIARNWFQNSGLKVKRVTYYIPPIFRKSYWLSLGLQKRQIAPSFMVVATN